MMDELVIDSSDEFPFNQVPFINSWVDYKGQTYWAMLNYEKSMAARRPIVDLAYCMTYDAPLQSVNYKPENFQLKPY